MNIHQLTAAALVATSLLMNGCASGDSRPPPSASSSNYSAYGVVEAIDVVSHGSGDHSVGAGTVIGGVVGGVLGHQIGGGSGKTAATVLGAVGGAVAGHEIQEHRNASASGDTYRVRVRLEQGGIRSVEQRDIGDLRVGDHVRIDNGAVFRD